ncbi:GDSL-type esterase/lipase family protein [Konateibacter massiliensis]|uniref:GDSL-type esterase/lipase family protein n=1 Tax=Konateibacter massiliensis TaxID=2002841 RepID=UPI000C1535B8|nr:GDSL-type esterase/lipase family protein [Konateibacter massiliensis]
MFQKIFQFGNTQTADAISVYANTLYSFEKGYGFLTEENRSENELLQIPELNDGFEIWYWYIGQKLIQIKQDDTGCYLTHSEKLPLSFKASVPAAGNYKLTVTITAGDKPLDDFMVFTGRRHLALRDINLNPHESHTFETIVNVCGFIPRGKEIPYTDNSICVTILGNDARISALQIEEIAVPTIYIAGDSTLTDQTGGYPYVPENSYCGWGQFLSFFLNNKASVSNHAHSGLTTESFRSEGHYSIIEKHIQPNDFFLLQFGHNDQKLSHLTAQGGYRENVLAYIREVREKKAFPVLVTPLCRNSWKGSDGTYHDLLEDYDKVIRQIGEEENVPVIALHKKSYDFITEIGLEDAKRYFFPGDFTHTNDFGGYKMASFIAEGFGELDELKEFLGSERTDWIPPQKIEPAKPPKGLENVKNPSVASFKVEFTDIDDCGNKDKIVELTSIGVIPNTDTLFRPTDVITRAEALGMVVKIANFFPTNVYNDMFKDVVGHEWYAGTVECAWSNGMVDKALVDENFYPQKEVSYEEMVSFVINGYKSRKTLPETKEAKTFHCTEWATPYYNAADAIGLLDTSVASSQLLTRQEAGNILYAFKMAM